MNVNLMLAKSSVMLIANSIYPHNSQVFKAKTDAKYDDIPYKSPSNESLQADSAVLKDGTEIYLGRMKQLT